MNPKYPNGWQKLIHCLLALPSLELMEEFIHLMLTEEEKEDLATRILIVEALMKGEKTQRQLAETLGVSIGKITRGSNELKRTSSALKDFLDTLDS